MSESTTALSVDSTTDIDDAWGDEAAPPAAGDQQPVSHRVAAVQAAAEPTNASVEEAPPAPVVAAPVVAAPVVAAPVVAAPVVAAPVVMAPDLGAAPPASRRHDLRAPRARRATRESSHFEAAPPERAPRGPAAAHAERPRRDLPVEAQQGEPLVARPTPTPTPKLAPTPTPKLAPTPTPKPAPTPTPAPKLAPAPAPAAMRSPTANRTPRRAPAPQPAAPLPAAAPAAPAHDLAILGARPVTELRKRHDGPQTSREAIQRRADRRQGKAARPGKAAKPTKQPRPQARPTTSDDKHARSRDRESARADVAERVAATPPAPPGLWARIKGFFGG